MGPRLLFLWTLSSPFSVPILWSSYPHFSPLEPLPLVFPFLFLLDTIAPPLLKCVCLCHPSCLPPHPRVSHTPDFVISIIISDLGTPGKKG